MDHRRYVHLDMLRACAALLVMASHLRSFVFQNYAGMATHHVIVEVFYIATGLGHQAVIIFFAMSGFLVGAPAYDAFRRGEFHWREYMLKRLTRLWIVMIPALIFTLAFDQLGISLTGGLGYDGAFHEIYNSGPFAPPVYSLGNFLGNVFFLATKSVPVFGTNGPIWSLTNEFFYYLSFPLLLYVFGQKTGAATRVVCAVVFLALAMAVPWDIVVLSVVWLAGAASGVLV